MKLPLRTLELAAALAQQGTAAGRESVEHLKK